MQLECANGKVYQNIDADTLIQALEALNSEENDFATLSSDKGFFQAAVSGSGFVVEYRDPSGYYTCSGGAVPAEDTKNAFLAYLNGDDSWKSISAWDRQAEEDPAAPPPGQGSSGRGGLVDDLIGSVKRDLKNAAKRKLGRFLKF